MELTQEILRELIHYNPDTGAFTWLERDIKWFSHCKNPGRQCDRWNTVFSGKVAGCKHTVNDKPYVYVKMSLFGIAKSYLGHTLSHILMNGFAPKYPEFEIDHIDGDGCNNSWNNFRTVTRTINCQNSKMRMDNSSGFTGVSWNKTTQRWQAYISVNKKRINGGFFDNIEDAIKRRKQLNVEHGFHKNHGRKDL